MRTGPPRASTRRSPRTTSRAWPPARPPKSRTTRHWSPAPSKATAKTPTTGSNGAGPPPTDTRRRCRPGPTPARPPGPTEIQTELTELVAGRDLPLPRRRGQRPRTLASGRRDLLDLPAALDPRLLELRDHRDLGRHQRPDQPQRLRHRIRSRIRPDRGLREAARRYRPASFRPETPPNRSRSISAISKGSSTTSASSPTTPGGRRPPAIAPSPSSRRRARMRCCGRRPAAATCPIAAHTSWCRLRIAGNIKLLSPFCPGSLRAESHAASSISASTVCSRGTEGTNAYSADTYVATRTTAGGSRITRASMRTKRRSTGSLSATWLSTNSSISKVAAAQPRCLSCSTPTKTSSAGGRPIGPTSSKKPVQTKRLGSSSPRRTSPTWRSHRR